MKTRLDTKIGVLLHVITDCQRQIKEKRDEIRRNEEELNRLLAREYALYEAKRIFERT
jgi:hypothetical protein